MLVKALRRHLFTQSVIRAVCCTIFPKSLGIFSNHIYTTFQIVHMNNLIAFVSFRVTLTHVREYTYFIG